MRVLPIALTPKRILLIGAGKVAAQKARAILASDCAFAVVTRDIRDPFFQAPFSVPLCLKAFELEDAQGQEIIVNATGDGALSKQLWDARKSLGYWLNCVDQPEYCDFYFTATHRNHDLCVSVSTGGASPRYAQNIRDRIAAEIPEQDLSFYQNLREGRNTGC
jgi:uroporphyrin-III C-methyltransferase/precorrin-2 dehydrogenase/sirohydrochlorin ferrochelatase